MLMLFVESELARNYFLQILSSLLSHQGTECTLFIVSILSKHLITVKVNGNLFLLSSCSTSGLLIKF